MQRMGKDRPTKPVMVASPGDARDWEDSFIISMMMMMMLRRLAQLAAAVP